MDLKCNYDPDSLTYIIELFNGGLNIYLCVLSSVYIFLSIPSIKIVLLKFNYDSLFVRTVAFPVQVAYWIKEVIAPCGYSVPCQF